MIQEPYVTTAPAKYPQNWDLDSLLPHPAKPEFPIIVDAYRRGLEALAEKARKARRAGRVHRKGFDQL